MTRNCSCGDPDGCAVTDASGTQLALVKANGGQLASFRTG